MRLMGRTVPWWMFLPILVEAMLPLWISLGGYLGYDFMPVPGGGGTRPRFHSPALEHVFYSGLTTLYFVDLVPAIVVSKIMPDAVPEGTRVIFAMFLIGTGASGLLFRVAPSQPRQSPAAAKT